VSEGFDRRSFLKRSGVVAAGVGLVGAPGLLAACGGSGKSGSVTSGTATGTTRSSGPVKALTTLSIPFLADMQVPDPDIFYEGEGLQVTTSVYEGLLTYAPLAAGAPVEYLPVAKRVAPGLAQAWEVSADGLTYTFHLRPNVTFHDGTPMDAASWIKSFVRRAKVNQGPAYMVAPVASTSAPDPLTFVVVLKTPCDPFLDYLACPWSPKAESPTAVAAHSVGDDLAQKWLSTNDCGSGPYMITEFVVSDHYTLQAYPGWWGPSPEVKTVTIPIIPNIQTQEIKLKAGQLDMITKGLAIQDVQSFEKNSKFAVEKFGIHFAESLYLNPTPGRIFADPAVRRALRRAIRRESLIKPVYGDTASLSTQFYPPGSFPDGAVPDVPPYDPSLLTSLVKNLPSKKVDMAYGEEGGATSRLMLELIQVQLQSLGLDVTVRGIPTSLEFSLTTTPDSQRPDVLLDVWGGDATHVDTDVRIFFRTGAAPLNWFGYSIPAADSAMDRGQVATDQPAVVAAYSDVAKQIMGGDYLLNIANIEDVFVSRTGITNFVHDPQASQVVRIADLHAG
jgi:peptide/nickel transport system substrate-binding protein